MSSAEQTCGRRVCAWCEPKRDLGPAPDIPAGAVTHGICEDCLARERAAVPTDSRAEAAIL